MASSGSRAMWLLVCALAICQVVSARSLLQTSKASVVLQAFKEITKLSDDLRIVTQRINLINAPLEGQKIAQGFGGIIQRISVELNRPDDGTKLGNADAEFVVASLRTFVQVHQALLNVVIGKHGLLTLIPFFEPIRQSLVSLEATVDAFAFMLIDMIPTQEAAAREQFGSLSITVRVAIQTYEQPL